jgi:YjbE family integral membrane protein
MDFSIITQFFTVDFLTALLIIIVIDLVLAGDNAIVIGLAAAGLPKELRAKAILVGIIAATVMRIAFASVTVQLLQIVGIVLAGGVLLLWVCWKMYRELRPKRHLVLEDGTEVEDAPPRAKSFWSAAWAVAIADLSMSLDNVLAVAGASKDHTEIMVVGLVLSVALMGIAANYIATLIERYPWIGWIGLALILYVAINMIVTGGQQVVPVVLPVIG